MIYESKNMKKTFPIIAGTLLLFLASCTLDNYESPDASLHGRILDTKTGELVGTDIQNGSQLMVYEEGYGENSSQTWFIMNTGEYRNNLVFPANYRVVFQNGNFYPFEENITVKSGDNEKDFKVTPYIRVLNPSITKSGNTVTATFQLEGGKPEVRAHDIRLFAYSDIYVGDYIKFALVGNTDKQTLDSAIDPSTTYTLTIDVKENATFFKYTGKNYYFRIGAKAAVEGVGTVLYNYSPLVKIRF